jgi:signal peptidase I
MVPFGTGMSISGNSVATPSDWIEEEDILLYDDRIVLNIKNATVSNYVATGSMRPVFDEGANGIRVVPSSEDDIEVGDIVSYGYNDGLIVHRVVEKGQDKNGVYFVVQGDNSLVNDGKIRFEDIEYVTIGVLY